MRVPAAVDVTHPSKGTVDPATEPAGGSAGQQDSTAPPEGRPAGWYRSMEHPWAARHYGFPADPDEGAQWNAEDGSGWTFDLTGSGWWEISRYANDARVAELEAALQTAREMYTSARERAAALRPVAFVVVREEHGVMDDVVIFDSLTSANTAEGIATGYAAPGEKYTVYALTDPTEEDNDNA